jgi:hypothetical protein
MFAPRGFLSRGERVPCDGQDGMGLSELRQLRTVSCLLEDSVDIDFLCSLVFSCS